MFVFYNFWGIGYEKQVQNANPAYKTCSIKTLAQYPASDHPDHLNCSFSIPHSHQCCVTGQLEIQTGRMPYFLAHLSRRLIGELIVYQSSCRLSVCLSINIFKHISETSGPIATKFYLKHHWVRGKNALGFGRDRIRTLVSMATDSSHRDIMGKML